MTRRILLTLGVVLLLSAFPVIAFAQGGPPTDPDFSGQLVQLINYVAQGIGVSLVTWLVRKYLLQRIPRVALPFVVMALGTGAQMLTALATGGQFNLVISALIGALALWVHEVKTTAEQHGLDP